MRPDEIEQIVLETIYDVTGYPAAQLAEHAEDDLIADLGMDSVNLLFTWAEIERRAGLESGDIASQQLITIQSITQYLNDVINRS